MAEKEWHHYKVLDVSEDKEKIEGMALNQGYKAPEKPLLERGKESLDRWNKSSNEWMTKNGNKWQTRMNAIGTGLKEAGLVAVGAGVVGVEAVKNGADNLMKRGSESFNKMRNGVRGMIDRYHDRKDAALMRLAEAATNTLEGLKAKVEGMKNKIALKQKVRGFEKGSIKKIAAFAV